MAHGSSSPSTLRVEIVDSFKGLLGLRNEWLALETASGAESPFQTWEWAVAWWCHLHKERPGVHDSLRVSVVRNASDDLRELPLDARSNGHRVGSARRYLLELRCRRRPVT